jgi:thymidylate kinase
MKMAKYICFEGTEGVGKTTQTKILVDYLRSQGFKVLQTKEPGTPLEPLTMTLRGIMLDNQYDNTLTRPAREFISQAIRSIHLERVIVPALEEYDYIVQDRGILSGYAYGVACGNSFNNIRNMAIQNVHSANDRNIFDISPESIYDFVVYLRGDSNKGLQKALATKQEFTAGDAMESRGNSFIEQVLLNMDNYSSYFNTVRIDVDGLSIEDVQGKILASLNLSKGILNG